MKPHEIVLTISGSLSILLMLGAIIALGYKNYQSKRVMVQPDKTDIPIVDFTLRSDGERLIQIRNQNFHSIGTVEFRATPENIDTLIRGLQMAKDNFQKLDLAT